MRFTTLTLPRHRVSGKLIPLTITLVVGTLLPGLAVACATCGCTLSTDAATGYSSVPGWRVNLQYDYIDQNQLRSGTGSVSPSEVAALNNPGGPGQEVEHDTLNRYITLGVTYRPDRDKAFSLLIPYIDRSHTTYGQATPDQLTPDQLSGVTVTGLGDIKFIASYQGFLPTHNLGVQLGVKLPTGNYGGPNASGTGIVGHNPTAFSTGPNAQQPSPGNLLDTSLQAGTGSTDLIIGAYYYQAVSQNFDAFVNGQFQTAVAHKLDTSGADYRPGDLATASFGLRYLADPVWVPQLQVNLSHKNRDEGALADTANTAGTVVYLSPGITVTVAKDWQTYGFVQLPLYSKLDGYQLFPRWTATVGLSHGF